MFGVTISPFLLNDTVNHHLDKYAEKEKAVTSKIIDGFYVDDDVDGCPTVSIGEELLTKSIMQDASFDLGKWVTNDPQLRNHIGSRELTEGNAPVKGD